MLARTHSVESSEQEEVDITEGTIRERISEAKPTYGANMKQGTVIVEAGKPLQFRDAVETGASPSAEQKSAILIADALKAYLVAARALLKGKYACYAELAPQHLRIPCDIAILRCRDGVFVRYDATTQGDPRARAGAMSTSLGEIAPQFSERLTHFGVTPEQLHPSELGPGLVLAVKDPTGATTQSLTLYPVIFATHLPEGFQIPGPPARPICFVSIQNELTLQLGGRVVPADAPLQEDGPDVQQFIAQSRCKLPVGWQAIEIYPLLGDEYWQPKYAATWAELDILAIAAQRNLQETQLNALDPRAETRRQYTALLAEFERHLEGPEEPVHQFLRQHPELISPTCDKHWSKLPFGAMTSDFVFREPHNDYELVEIEAADRRLFRKDGQQHEELTHAINQIAEWVRYIEDNKKTVEDELGLTGISTSPRSLVVIGRSQSLTEENRRKLTTLQNQHSKLRILTYDDLLAGARANLERILGPLTLSITGENVKLCFFR
ncbi:MAG: DUF4263 domain-containing protein [Planctomycetes bacterium]|nr:DUF4263 domain-containing protein [Planctomycetota bacterium]